MVRIIENRTSTGTEQFQGNQGIPNMTNAIRCGQLEGEIVDAMKQQSAKLAW